MKQPTKEQIAAWKEKHGDIFQLTSEDGLASCIMRKPTRHELSYATKMSKINPMAFNDCIVKSCWLDGDDVMRTDDGYYLGICAKLETIIQIKEVEIKNL